MKYWLSLTLAALAALSFAGCVTPVPAASKYTAAATSVSPNCSRLARPGDTKIQIYCKSGARHVPAFTDASASSNPSADTTCRQLASPADNKIDTFCGTTAQWDAFDTRAAIEGVTCRWTPGPARQVRELCLPARLWNVYLANRKGQEAAASGANWPSTGVPVTPPQTLGGSYGYFPAGTAIGATR